MVPSLVISSSVTWRIPALIFGSWWLLDQWWWIGCAEGRPKIKPKQWLCAFPGQRGNRSIIWIPRTIHCTGSEFEWLVMSMEWTNYDDYPEFTHSNFTRMDETVRPVYSLSSHALGACLIQVVYWWESSVREPAYRRKNCWQSPCSGWSGRSWQQVWLYMWRWNNERLSSADDQTINTGRLIWGLWICEICP